MAATFAHSVRYRNGVAGVTDKPGRQQLSGYVMRDYGELIARLGEGTDDFREGTDA